ncbi:MAG: TolC family protein [Verrucomicrobiales bacterium]|nr:TolC family protein [Verrucomicrobiales bacterium]
MKTQNLLLSKTYQLCLFSLVSYFAVTSIQAAEKTSININQALARALVSNPSLNVFDEDMRKAEAQVLSASLLINPQLQTELEDFAGTGVYSGTGNAIYNVGISQMFRLGGKRRANIDFKTSQKENLRLYYETQKRNISEQVGLRFVGVLQAQEMQQNRQQILKITEESELMVKTQVDGGRGSSISLNQAELAVMNARMAYQTAAQRTKISRIQLAGLWNQNEPDFTRVLGSLSTPPAKIPEIEIFLARVPNHPAVQQAEAVVQVAQKSWRYQRTQRIPNLSLALGYRRDASVDENAIVLGATLPLPLFNRNQGGIANAAASMDRAEQQQKNTLATLQVKLSQTYSELALSHMMSRLIETELMPKARESFKATEESHRLGRTTYLQLLEAQRNLTTMLQRRTEAFAQFHQARISLEALTGKPLR